MPGIDSGNEDDQCRQELASTACTLADVFAELDGLLEPEERDELRCIDRNSRLEMIGLHFGLGLLIRNRFLRGDSPFGRDMETMGHADDISAAIASCYLDHLHGDIPDGRELAQRLARFLFDPDDPRVRDLVRRWLSAFQDRR